MAERPANGNGWKIDVRGVAIHEAGHAVVARFFGLRVATITIDLRNERALGRTQIEGDEHLPLVDRVAIRMAGVAAQNFFRCPTQDSIGMSDYVRIGSLVNRLGRLRSLEVRAIAYQCAYDIVRTHRREARALSRALMKSGRVHYASLDAIVVAMPPGSAG